MAKGDLLGEFELYVLAAVQQLDGAAYGITIADEIERRTARVASLGSVYATVERLADKGFVAFHVGDAQPERGGRARKCSRITPAGRRALVASVRAFDRMVDGLPVRPATMPRR
jgi:DNA-binding PadR family transcriptional regulator